MNQKQLQRFANLAAQKSLWFEKRIEKSKTVTDVQTCGVLSLLLNSLSEIAATMAADEEIKDSPACLNE